MAQGTIKTLMQDRGFGFITIDEQEGRNLSDAVFFHKRDCQSTASFERLRNGSRVECRLVESDRGADRLKAVDVILLADRAIAA
jgi:cold shock CspA family protein